LFLFFPHVPNGDKRSGEAVSYHQKIFIARFPEIEVYVTITRAWVYDAINITVYYFKDFFLGNISLMHPCTYVI
jgi:hypothetical protein